MAQPCQRVSAFELFAAACVSGPMHAGAAHIARRIPDEERAVILAAAPTMIKLCRAGCDAINAGGTTAMELGCGTVALQ